jgi:glutamate 5-kinase
MKSYLKHREYMGDAKRLVVKIGSRVLVQKSGRPHRRRMEALVKQLAFLRAGGREIVLITSGAVGTGMAGLGMRTKPTALPDLQMAAAVGQARLMSLYDSIFSRFGCRVGQVLLTHDDFHNSIRQSNARRTMENMLQHRVIPIVNENDVVAVEELKADLKKLGDNDVLAGMVTKMLHADLLILLTTADGVREFKGDGKSRRIPLIEKITPRIMKLVAPKDSGISTGGMGSKLKAAKSVSESGIAVVIADGRKPADLHRIMAGDNVGTFILPSVED